jgi:hypothetical protein
MSNTNTKMIPIQDLSSIEIDQVNGALTNREIALGYLAQSNAILSQLYSQLLSIKPLSVPTKLREFLNST